MIPHYLAFFSLICSPAIAQAEFGVKKSVDGYSSVLSSVKNAVGRIGLLGDHSSALREINSILAAGQTSKEIQSSLLGFSETVLREGMIRAASMGNHHAIQAFLNYGVVDADTIEQALIAAGKHNQWKVFSLLVPFASEDSFRNVPSLEHAFSNISNRNDLLQLVDKTKNYSLILYSVLLNAIRTGKIDVVNAIFIRDSKLLQDDQVLEMVKAYFEDIVSVQEFENIKNIKDWIIIHGIVVADEAGQTKMVKFLLSMIDLSTENNLLLRTASFYGNMDLVNYALKYENVVRQGLDDAIRLSSEPEIRDFLLSAHMFFLIDELASSRNASPAA